MPDFPYNQKIACLALHLAGQSVRAVFKFPENEVYKDFIQSGFRLYSAGFKQMMEKAWETCQSHEEKNMEVLTFACPAYPESLKRSLHPPLALFYIGQISLLQRPMVSIVGTRNPSLFTMVWLRHICHFLSGAGYTLVSGLALGIDSIVHANSCDRGTIGVAPQSLDIVSPKIHDRLYEKARSRKHPVLILSEYPATTPARKYHYAHRNRVIAGLSPWCIFAEGNQQSGAMITAKWCLKNERKLFVLNSQLQKNNFGGQELIKTGQADDIGKYFPFETYEVSYEQNANAFQPGAPVYLGDGRWVSINEERFSPEFLAPG